MTSQNGSQSGGFVGVFVASDLREVVVEFQGQQIPIKVRELGWSAMNQLISQSTTYTDRGEGKFNLDTYYKLYFSRAIVESPWGAFNVQLVESFTPEFGRALEALIPEARPSFGSEEDAARLDFFDTPSESTSENEINSLQS